MKKVAKKSSARKKQTASLKSTQRAPSAAKRTRSATQPAIFPKLHALLQTVQTIAQYEDQLCTLTHEARTAGTLSPEAQEELHALLLELPASTYHAELDALHEALHGMEISTAEV